MKKLAGIVLCVMVLCVSLYADAEGSGGETVIPDLGLKAGMNFDEIRGIMTDRGFTFIEGAAGTDEDGTEAFSMVFTGNLQIFDVPVSAIVLSMQDNGGILYLRFQFLGHDYNSEKLEKYGDVPLHYNVDKIYSGLLQSMTDSLGEPFRLTDRLEWQEEKKWYDLSKPTKRSSVAEIMVISFDGSFNQ